MKKVTLQEHIARIKEISMLRENVGQQPQQQDNIQQQTDAEFEKGLDMAVKDLQNQLPQLAKTVGDKDGQLEPAGSNQINEMLNEAGLLSLGISAALSAPKMAELLGNALQKSGKKFDSERVQKWGEYLAKKGHKLHSAYLGLIKKIIKPFMSKSSDEEIEKYAERVLLSVILIAGVNAFESAASAAAAGKGSFAAAKGGLGTIKAGEIFNAVRKNIGGWLSTFTT